MGAVCDRRCTFRISINHSHYGNVECCPCNWNCWFAIAQLKALSGYLAAKEGTFMSQPLRHQAEQSDALNVVRPAMRKYQHLALIGWELIALMCVAAVLPLAGGLVWSIVGVGFVGAIGLAIVVVSRGARGPGIAIGLAAVVALSLAVMVGRGVAARLGGRPEIAAVDELPAKVSGGGNV